MAYPGVFVEGETYHDYPIGRVNFRQAVSAGGLGGGDGGGSGAKYTNLSYTKGVSNTDSNGQPIAPPVSSLHFATLIWDPSLISPSQGPGIGAGSAAGVWVGNTWTVSTSMPTKGYPGPGSNAIAADSAGFVNPPLIYTGPLVNCTLTVTILSFSIQSSSNCPIEVFQDGVSILAVNLNDSGTFPAPGVYVIPFIISAGVASVIQVGNGSCQSFDDAGGPVDFSYTATLTPA